MEKYKVTIDVENKPQLIVIVEVCNYWQVIESVKNCKELKEMESSEEDYNLIITNIEKIN